MFMNAVNAATFIAVIVAVKEIIMSICPTTGKTQYDSEKAASVGLERMKKYKPDYDGEPYFCMYCSNYHFGKKQEKPVKKKRKRT